MRLWNFLVAQFYKAVAQLTGQNPKGLPTGVVLDQLSEPRPLPMGKDEFEVWANRIISGSLVPIPSEGVESLKFALAMMIPHLGPHESHKPDAHFIHGLRKAAANQVAVAIAQELREKAKAKTSQEEKTAEQKDSEDKAATTLARIQASKEAKGEVENPRVQSPAIGVVCQTP